MSTVEVAADSARTLKAFISGKTATEILTCSYPRLRQLAADGAIKVRKVPGCHPRYSLADVLELAGRAQGVEEPA